MPPPHPLKLCCGRQGTPGVHPRVSKVEKDLRVQRNLLHAAGNIPDSSPLLFYSSGFCPHSPRRNHKYTQQGIRHTAKKDANITTLTAGYLLPPDQHANTTTLPPPLDKHANRVRPTQYPLPSNKHATDLAHIHTDKAGCKYRAHWSADVQASC